MKIIALEGIDASGKETQVAMLVKYLAEKGYSVASDGFPRYGTQLGYLIRKGLKNEIDMNDKTLHMLLEADRMNFQDTITNYEILGYDFMVLDRYTMSNLAFGMAKGIDLNWLKTLQEGIRKPDLTIVLDISAETSFKRKTIGRDRHELDSQLLNRARAAYNYLGNELANTEGADELVYVLDANGTPDEVHVGTKSLVNLAFGISE